jgi:signal transduction histidine kinase
VFINLVQNAIQHAPAGTDVLIEAEAQGSEASPTLQITIRDAGPGFAAEDLPSAFCPFFSRRKGGTGLGLAIVRRIVEEHHGTVTVGNDPRGGAVVHLMLPACR